MPANKRIQYHQYGGPELLRLESVERPVPHEGEILVRVAAAAVNPMDRVIRSGEVKFMTGRRFPRGLGHDFAGTVELIGQSVTGFSVGDEVLGAASMRASGAFAEFVVVDADKIVKKPEQLTFQEAAVLPTVGVTALQALDKARLTANQSIFIHGCLGGVGRTAVQLAVNRGAAVGGSCRASSREQAMTLGVDPLVDFDFDAAKLAGRFDVVFDTAGTLPLKAARTLLKRGGSIIDINGSAAKMIRSATARDFSVLISKYKAEDLAQIAASAAAGALSVPIARTVELDDAVEALTELEVNRTPNGGKLVITNR